VGVRETRQATGDYVMTGADIVEARKHPDGVARASYWIDTHCPYGYVGRAHVCRRDCPMGAECDVVREAPDQLPESLHPPEGDWTDVPYRSLTVKGAPNLLVAGRCISADHHAMGAIRVMATCMAMGEAAGAAAAMAAAVENWAAVASSTTELRRAAASWAARQAARSREARASGGAVARAAGPSSRASTRARRSGFWGSFRLKTMDR